jgi:hypothetical protein
MIFTDQDVEPVVQLKSFDAEQSPEGNGADVLDLSVRQRAFVELGEALLLGARLARVSGF